MLSMNSKTHKLQPLDHDDKIMPQTATTIYCVHESTWNTPKNFANCEKS